MEKVPGGSDFFRSPETSEPVRKIWTEGFEHPRIIKTPTGELVCGIDIGINRKRQEDALVIDAQNDSFAVIDGMGGMGKGDAAARILAETLFLGFSGEKPFREMQVEASERMNEIGIYSGGACYTGIRIRDGHLLSSFAGDVQLVIANKEGEVVHIQKAEGVGNIVFNSVQGENAGKTSSDILELKTGYRCIVASDGLWGNIHPGIAAQEVAGLPLIDALTHLSTRAKNKMEHDQDEGKPDNLTILIYDYLGH